MPSTIQRITTAKALLDLMNEQTEGSKDWARLADRCIELLMTRHIEQLQELEDNANKANSGPNAAVDRLQHDERS